jgi:hypothetical protein
MIGSGFRGGREGSGSGVGATNLPGCGKAGGTGGSAARVGGIGCGVSLGTTRGVVRRMLSVGMQGALYSGTCSIRSYGCVSAQRKNSRVEPPKFGQVIR